MPELATSQHLDLPPSLDLSDNAQITAWARLFKSGKVKDQETLSILEEQLRDYLRVRRTQPMEENNVGPLKELLSSLGTYEKSLHRLSEVRKETLDKRLKAKSKTKKLNGYNSLGQGH